MPATTGTRGRTGGRVPPVRIVRGAGGADSPASPRPAHVRGVGSAAPAGTRGVVEGWDAGTEQAAALATPHHHAVVRSSCTDDSTWWVACWCGADYQGATHRIAYVKWEQHQLREWRRR